jgi:hypothetical protein
MEYHEINWNLILILGIMIVFVAVLFLIRDTRLPGY